MFQTTNGVWYGFGWQGLSNAVAVPTFHSTQTGLKCAQHNLLFPNLLFPDFATKKHSVMGSA
jgi:hypothetical protein